MVKNGRIVGAFLMVLCVMLALTGCAEKKAAEQVKPSTPSQEVGAAKSITTEELKANLGKSDWVVVDTRVNDAFNGWKLDGVARGGHIKGATDFSAYWLNLNGDETKVRLDEALKNKGITADKKVVLYDANGKDAIKVAEFLKGKGFSNLYTYDVKAWAADDALALVRYPNYKNIVPASFIKDLMDGKQPETYSGAPYKIFEVSWGEEKNSYLAGHIPGAIHINTDEEEAPPLWSLNSDDKLIKFAENNGITIDTMVVLEGQDPMASYRVAAILKYLGVKDVRVLNGGFDSWKREGYPVETESHPKVAVKDFGAKTPQNKGYIIDIAGAKKVLADRENSILVDIRSLDEHTGKITGYSDLKFKGRPAGAVWGHAGSDPNHLEEFRNVDNTMRNADEILAMWAKEGITPDKNLSFFCGSGWRAAEVEVYADTMGIQKFSMYANGWYEWSSNPKNPVELGESK